MNLLLDTQAFLWFVTQSPLLSSRAKTILETKTPCFISIASVWELAIKVSIGKLTVPQPFRSFIEEQLKLNTIELLPITIADTASMMTLPHHHRDPFDRLIVAQALTQKLTVISSDRTLDTYGITREW